MNLSVFDIPIDTLRTLLLNSEKTVKKQCLEYIMMFTGEPSNCKPLFENSGLLVEIVKSITEDNGLSKLALNALINIASVEDGATAIFEADIEHGWKSLSTLNLFKQAMERNFSLAEHASNVLTNMTTWESLTLKIGKVFISKDCPFNVAFEAVHNKNYNPKCPNLSQHLCQLFGNLAQSIEFQKYLLSAEDGHLFCSILALINNGDTALQKRGIVSMVYNCLFTTANHLPLLNPPFSILTYLLYPLAGSEEFDEEEVDKMPIELQYLGFDKERESDSEIRKLLLKSLLMLCETKSGRIFLRDQQTYPILREYHKWEKDPSLTLACENVVDILIRTEDEIGLENIRSVDVPEDLKEKFDKMDADFVQESSS